MRVIAGLICAVLLIIAATACTEDIKSDRGRGDTGIEGVDGSKAWVIEMPDGYANIATKCIWKGFRAFAGTSDNRRIIIMEDPTCEQPAYAGPSR